MTGHAVTSAVSVNQDSAPEGSGWPLLAKLGQLLGSRVGEAAGASALRWRPAPSQKLLWGNRSGSGVPRDVGVRSVSGTT